MQDFSDDLDQWWDDLGPSQQLALIAEAETGSDELSPEAAALIYRAGVALGAGFQQSTWPWPPKIREFVLRKGDEMQAAGED